VIELLSGLVLLILGAELMVRAAVRLAARLHVRPLIIGLTIVALGSSARNGRQPASDPGA
jgi:cation:H+ antiporter